MCKAIDELREMSRQEGIAQGRAEERSNAEKIILALQQKIDKLEGQLVMRVQ